AYAAAAKSNGKAAAKAEAASEQPTPGIGDQPDPGDLFTNVGELARGNRRLPENYALDVYEHPIMMQTFAKLAPRAVMIEVAPENDYWSEFFGTRLSETRGRFIQAVDETDKDAMTARKAEADYWKEQCPCKIEIVPLNADSFGGEGIADQVLLSRKM